MATKKQNKIAAAKILAAHVNCPINLENFSNVEGEDANALRAVTAALHEKLINRLTAPIARYEKREAARQAREAKVQARKDAKAAKALARETIKAEKLAAKEAAQDAKEEAREKAAKEKAAAKTA